VRRRWLLGGLAAAPGLALVPALEARDYRTAAEVLGEIERLGAGIDVRLDALAERPAAATFVASAKSDLARHRRERRDLPGAGPPAPIGPVEEPASVGRLRADLSDLMYAHAEGLPAFRDRGAVERLAAHMIDVSRLVTIVDLWLDVERGDE